MMCSPLVGRLNDVVTEWGPASLAVDLLDGAATAAPLARRRTHGRSVSPNRCMAA